MWLPKNFWMNIFKDERRNLVGSILIADDFRFRPSPEHSSRSTSVMTKAPHQRRDRRSEFVLKVSEGDVHHRDIQHRPDEAQCDRENHAELPKPGVSWVVPSGRDGWAESMSGFSLLSTTGHGPYWSSDCSLAATTGLRSGLGCGSGRR